MGFNALIPDAKLKNSSQIKARKMKSFLFRWTFPVVVCMVFLITLPANAFLGSKFKDEAEKEKGAVKLVREVVRGGYDRVTTEELNAWKGMGYSKGKVE